LVVRKLNITRKGNYLWHNQVLLKEFGKHAERTSNRLKAASVEEVERIGRPVKLVKRPRQCLFLTTTKSIPCSGS
jgi:hypothetical protein